MKYSDVYKSDWLKASDFNGRPRKMRIEDVTLEKFKQEDGTSEEKLALAFVGANKRLVLNRTNGKVLVGLFGDDTDAWPGNQVILSPGVASNGKDTIVITGTPAEEEAGTIPF